MVLFQRRGGVPRELPRGPTGASRSVPLLLRDDWRRGARVEQPPHQEVYDRCIIDFYFSMFMYGIIDLYFLKVGVNYVTLRYVNQLRKLYQN